MTKIEQRWHEIPVAIGWLVTSVVLMETLRGTEWLVETLQPMTSVILAEPSIFSGWNRNVPFHTEAAKALTALFILLMPIQVASVFMIPARAVCFRAQTKGIPAFAAILAVFFSVQPLVFTWGLSINGPIKIFGKESSWGAAAAICLVTLSLAYAIRMTPVLLNMFSTQMFLDSGDGVVFRGAVGPWYSPTNKQFHLTREKARELMALIVTAYRQAHNGASPTELFVHGKTRFSIDEWEGFRDTVPENCKVACVQIREDLSLKLFRPGDTNVARCLGWVETPSKGYLWTKGFIPRLQTYPGREVPNPLSIEVVRGEADIKIVMSDVLALTKLNYNTCIFSDGVPVTLRFADTIGEILTAGPIRDDLPPLPFRYYI